MSSGAQHVAKDSALNTAGTIFYYACQWLTTVVVARVAGFEDAGIYALAVSLTNIFSFIALFGVRAYQISDLDGKATDGSYFAARWLTCAASVLLFAVCLLFVPLSPQAIWSSVALMAFKIMEAFGDAFFGVFQKTSRYKSICLSFVLKGAATLAVFAVVLWLAGLVWACLAMAGAYLLVLLLYDLPVMTHSDHYTRGPHAKEITQVIRACLPIMVYTLVVPYVNFITRYVVGQHYSDEILGYYSSISMVIAVLSTLAGSIWAVLVPRNKRLFMDKQYRGILKNALVIVGGVVVITLVALLAGRWFGGWLLGLVFGQSIVPYSNLVNPMLISGSLLMLVSYFSVMLVAFGRRTAMLLANLAGAVVCTVSVVPFVNLWGLIGACASLILCMGVQAVILGAIFVATLLSKKNNFNTV